ncbi:MAG: N-acetylmuramoyl-L-alanine amidase [Chloroflexi bacterium]|nr:N-acetylmuramoyl-L-alanine amidase [Chloroflexota bacterium]
MSARRSPPRAARPASGSPLRSKAGPRLGSGAGLWLSAAVVVAVGAWFIQGIVAPAGGASATPPGAGRNTPVPPRQIGLIAGHNRLKTLPNGDAVRDTEGLMDTGAVCDDGTTEADITLNVARRVAAELRDQDKLPVELLGEFDARLRGYFGQALISIHVDACIRNLSGYKVARLIESAVPETEDRLVNCLRERYAAITGLPEHRNTITPDMQEYHAFREIALTTPGAIIELGFLRDDQAILKQGDLPVKGVLEGIRCFLKGR